MNHILSMLKGRSLSRYGISNRSVNYGLPLGVHPAFYYVNGKRTWRVVFKEDRKAVTYGYMRTLGEATDVATLIKSVRYL
jgi:hypothetical protein